MSTPLVVHFCHLKVNLLELSTFLVCVFSYAINFGWKLSVILQQLDSHIYDLSGNVLMWPCIQMNYAENFYHLVPCFYNFSSGNVADLYYSHDERSIITCISYKYFHLFCCTDCHFHLNTTYHKDCRNTTLVPVTSKETSPPQNSPPQQNFPSATKTTKSLLTTF